MPRDEARTHRLTIVGLVAVMLLLGGVTLWTLSAGRAAAEEVETRTRVVRAIERVERSATTQRLLVVEAVAGVDPPAVTRAAFARAASELEGAVAELRRTGTADDARSGDAVLAAHRRVRTAAREVFAAAERGDPYATFAVEARPAITALDRAAAELEGRRGVFDRLFSLARSQRTASLVALVALVSGLVLVAALLAGARALLRRRRRLEEEHAEAEERLERVEERNIALAIDLATVGEVARAVREGADPRQAVVSGARQVSGAASVALLEPVGGGQELGVVATAGAVARELHETPTAERDAALAGGSPTFAVDEQDGHTTLWQPLRVADRTVALLAVTWACVLPEPPDPAATALSALAEESALAIDRAELLARLGAPA